MLRKLSTLVLVVMLISGLGSSSGFAQSLNASDTKPSEPPQLVQSDASENLQVRPNDKLKSDVGTLVSDTKAGKLKLADAQSKSAKRHNLSKGAKIAIGVGIGIAVLALVAIHVRNHMFDNFRLFDRGGSIGF